MTSPTDAIAEAAALLLAHDDPEVQALGTWMLAGAPGSLMEALGHENEPGYSARLGAALPERDRLLRSLVPPGSAGRLARDLHSYSLGQWPQTKACTSCPHEEGSREGVFWRVLRLRDRPLSARQIRAILAAITSN